MAERRKRGKEVWRGRHMAHGMMDEAHPSYGDRVVILDAARDEFAKPESCAMRAELFCGY